MICKLVNTIIVFNCFYFLLIEPNSNEIHTELNYKQTNMRHGKKELNYNKMSTIKTEVQNNIDNQQNENNVCFI